MAKPSAAKIAADAARFHQFQLERVLGEFMGTDGGEAYRQFRTMFGSPPELEELNGKPFP